MPRTDDKFKTGGALDGLRHLVRDAEAADPVLGQRLGNYSVESILAEGGMGRVYLGNRTDGSFDRQVAIKVLPLGSGGEYARRFELERQILASLSHPGIAQVYDAGATDSGNLFLVMELVDGQPIDRYVVDHALDIKAKTELVISLCDGLAYAHARLIVHRDIKPSNVYVTREGKLKLLDFGIAKILETPDDLTVASRPMTPKYASPEQLLNRPVSVASDIYQVGLLFLSLFEQKQANEAEIGSSPTELAVRKASITVESRVSERLPAELSAIINKCLQVEPADRYTSAAELATDLRNYLGGYPVSARNPDAMQRGWKFVKRNWLPTGAIGIVFVSLTASLLLTLHQQAVTNEARELAERQRNRAEATTRFLVGLFDANAPDQALGQHLSAQDILERGLERIQMQEGEPELKADLLQTIGSVYQNLGNIRLAIPLVEQALRLRESIFGAESLEAAVTMSTLGSLYQIVGDNARAVDMARRAYDIRYESLGRRHPDTLDALAVYGFTLQRSERYDEAETILLAVLDGKQEIHGEDHVDVITATSNLAVLYGERGDFERALSYGERVLEWDLANLPAEHPWLSTALYNHGVNLSSVGRFDEALEALHQSLAIRERVDGANYVWLGRIKREIASTLRRMGRYKDSLELRLQAQETMLRAVTPPNPSLARVAIGLGAAYIDLGHVNQAEEQLADAAEQLRQLDLRSAGYPELVSYQTARIRIAQERFDEAIAILTPIVEGELLLDSHLKAGILISRAYRLSGNLSEAERMLEQALNTIDARSGRSNILFVDAQLEAAELYLDLNNPAKAVEAIRLHRDFYENQLTREYWGLAFGRVLSMEAQSREGGKSVSANGIARDIASMEAALPRNDARLKRAYQVLADIES